MAGDWSRACVLVTMTLLSLLPACTSGTTSQIESFASVLRQAREHGYSLSQLSCAPSRFITDGLKRVGSYITSVNISLIDDTLQIQFYSAAGPAVEVPQPLPLAYDRSCTRKIEDIAGLT